jgi:uncharacterized protein (TIGR02099 family)
MYWWHKFKNKLALLLALSIILFALLISVTRLLSPILNQHKPFFTAIAGKVLHQTVTIAEVKVTWSGYRPELTFDQVTIVNPQTGKALFVIPQVKIRLGIWQSLFQRQFVLDGIKVSGIQLTLRQQNTGQLLLDGLTELNVVDNYTGNELDSKAILAWIFSQPLLTMTSVNIHFISMRGHDRLITLHELTLENSDQQHSLVGNAILNQSLRTNLTINFQWQGDIQHLEDINAHLYLAVQNISLARWFRGFQWHDLSFAQGVGTGEVWADWHKNTWQRIQAKFKLAHLALVNPTKKIFTLKALAANLDWQDIGDQIVLTGTNVAIDLPTHTWPQVNFKLTLAKDNLLAYQLDQANFNYLNLYDIVSFLTVTELLPKKLDFLATINLQGELVNLKADLQSITADQIDFKSLSGEFNQLSFANWQNYPGVNNASGQFAVNHQQGQLRIDSKNIQITYPHWFNYPLEFAVLSAKLNWQETAAAKWQLSLDQLNLQNNDLMLHAQINLSSSEQMFDTLDMNGDFSVNDIGNLNHYLPLNVFDKKVSHWLRSAFKQGKTSAGKIKINGLIADFPFADPRETFLIKTNFNNLELNFSPEWPTLQNMAGTLVFDHRAMSVDLTQAEIFKTNITNAHAEIPYIGDDKPQILTVTGAVATTFSQAQKFIHATPLRTTLGKALAPIELIGSLPLTLNLTIPLANPDKTLVLGKTQLDNVVLKINDWHLDLEKINGQLEFTEHTLTATSLEANLFQKPITLALSSPKNCGDEVCIDALIKGDIAMSTLATWLQLPVQNYLTGDTFYNAKLQFSSAANTPDLQMTLQTNLQGVSVVAPAPFNKSSATLIPTQLYLETTKSNALRVKLIYGKLGQAAFLLNQTNKGFTVINGEIALGQHDADWQTQPGIILTGQLANFTTASINSMTQTAGTSDFVKLFRSVRLTIANANIYNQVIKNLSLQADKKDQYWQIHLASAIATGDIKLPRNLTKNTIIANFDHLALTSDKKTIGAFDPRALPAVNFNCADFSYAAKSFGQVTLNLEPIAKGVTIKTFQINSPLLKLEATGAWTLFNNFTQTHLIGTASTAKASELLTQWEENTAKNLIANNGNINFDLTWSAAPYQFTLEKLQGSLTMKLGEGQIINLDSATSAKMGLGRILNVFSLSTLSRRLSLDFSDLLQKGYSFDVFKGDYQFNKGNITTTNTFLNGPVAKIKIIGRLGMLQKDYDVQLNVTPYVTSSLPVVAMLAVNPLAGVATWAVDKIVSHEFSKIITYNYKVTGTWDKPIITKQ